MTDGLRAENPAFFETAQQRHHALAEGFLQRLGVPYASVDRLAHSQFPFAQALMVGIVCHLPDLAVAIPHCRRQHRADGIVKGTEIALTHPKGQLQLTLRENRLIIQTFPDGFQRFFRHRVIKRQYHRLAGAVAASKRHQHTRAYRNAQSFGRQIVVGLVNGIGCRGYCHLGDLRH